MKRVLIISYYWPPTGGSGVQRWVKFSKYLPKYGWQPVVYTPENPEALVKDDSLLADIPSEVEVIKTHITEPYDIYRKFFGKGAASAGGREVNPINSQKKTLKQKISLFIRGNFFIPDPRVGWVKPSVKFLVNYLKEHPVDVMVTTGPPQSMHLIGLGVHKATGIPWVVDFRDPWTKMFYFKNLCLTPLAAARHRRMEQSVLDGCSRIIAVSPLVQDDFRAMTSTRVDLITNGYDAQDYAAEPAGHEGFRMVHTGLFASDGNPLALWKALAGKCSEDREFASALQIRLAGKTDSPVTDSIKAAGLADKLVDLGYCSHTKAVEEQKEADVLLLPLRQDPEYRKVLPGKIFECIAAQRRVIGIGQTDGAAAMLLEKTSAGRMFAWDDEQGIRDAIDDAWAHRSEEFTIKDAAQLSREALTEKLVGVFEELI